MLGFARLIWDNFEREREGNVGIPFETLPLDVGYSGWDSEPS